jgi:hypothetical protein
MGPTEILFHTNGLNRTNVHTNSAINAGTGINNSLVFNHAYCLAGTFLDTGLASGAFLGINFSWHLHNPFQKNQN